MLSPAREELQIELIEGEEFRNYFEGENNSLDPVGCDPGELTEWLFEIARSKEERYPKLRKLVTWSGEYAPTVAVWVNMQRYHNYDQIEEAFREAHVQIAWVDCQAPGLFSV